MSLLVKPTPSAWVDHITSSPSAIRYQLPHLLDRAKQDLLAGDTLAYQRTMQRVAETEREIHRQDQMLQKMLQAEAKKK